MKTTQLQHVFFNIAFHQRLRLGFLFILLMGLFCPSANAQTFVDRHGQLKVQGNRIVDKNGAPVQLRGMSLYWSQWVPKYYNYNTVKWLRDDWCINVIRIAVAGGSPEYQNNPAAEKNKVFTVVDAAIDLGIYVIIDWHDHTAHERRPAVEAFFTEMAQKYGDKPNVLYEIFNEPLDVSWANVLKPYHTAVIDKIRAVDPDNIIICGTRNWSQQVNEAALNPIARTNIAYTLHYYASTHRQWLRDVAQTAMNNGAALFVTEYGTTEASGKGVIDAAEARTWWDFLNRNYIGHCNWSVADIPESSAALVSGASVNGGWTTSQIKLSGQLVRNELKARCEVITNPPPTVMITAPATNTTYTAPATVTINASASDPNGTVSNVRFYNGTTLLGSDASAPYSFSWTNVAAGTYTITARATDNGGAVTTSSPVTVIVNVPQGPYMGTQTPIPGKVEAERYDVGGQGVAYNDADAVNSGGQFRTDGVDIQVTTDAGGGYNVGWIAAAEWLEYTVNVTATGKYNFNVRVASSSTGKSMHIELGGVNITGAIAVPNTGGYQAWQTITIPNINLTAGNNQLLRVYFDTDGINLNFVEVVVPSCTTPAPGVVSPVSLCQNTSASALTATGTALKWYTVSSGGTSSSAAPLTSTSSAGTVNHYVSQTVNGCEGPRATIAVVVNPLPAAAITAGGPTTFTEGGSVELSANTGSGLTYKWFNGTVQVGTDAQYTAISSGNYTVEVTNSFTCKAISIAVTVSVQANQPPALAITSPLDQSTVTAPVTIYVNATDADGTITKVEYLEGTTVLGESTVEPHSFTWNNAFAGDHVITARATDSHGAVTMSSPVTITVEVKTGVVGRGGTETFSLIYPNPTNGALHIETVLDLSKATIRIINVLGAEVTVPVTVKGDAAEAELGSLTEGTYILLIEQDNYFVRKKITVIP